MKNDCVFCDRAQLEESIIFENEDWYVVATLGQITDGGYVLLIPKAHIPCTAALNRALVKKSEKFVAMISRALSVEYQNSFCRDPYPVVLFEHGIVGQTIKHAHLHFLPTVVDVTISLYLDFPVSDIEGLSGIDHLRRIYEERKELYLFWRTPNGRSMVCWNPPAQQQYFRTLFAKFLGRPERANWRDMDPELDKKLCRETVVRLRPYFRHLSTV